MHNFDGKLMYFFKETNIKYFDKCYSKIELFY